MPIFSRVLILLLLTGLSARLYSQGVNTTFGQNRLQYKTPDWQVLTSENVDAYYYEGGENLAAYAQLYAEENISDVEEFLGFRAGSKVQIIVFNTIEDLRQSNTGLQEQLFNVGGHTYVVDNKVIAYFDGSHAHFEQQILRGIAEIILSEMIYGSSIQERVQSSSLLFLPSWFFKGLTSYISNNWDTDIDSKVRDGILSGKFQKFNWLSEEDAILAGHSIWNYIVEKYGVKTVPEILFLTRISKGYEAAFNYSLGINGSRLIDDWLEYYEKRYKETEADREVPRKLLHIPDRISGYPHTQIKTHPNGRRIAFVMNKNGQWHVKIYDKNEKKEYTVLKGGKQEGYQVINYAYPVLAWEPGGKHLGVIYYEKGRIKMVKIDRDSKISARYTLPEDVDQVLSYDFADAHSILISAIKNGQTDLYIYNLDENSLTQITNDVYDDLWPRFNDERTQIIFSSNRPTDSLNVHDMPFETLYAESNFDIFLFNYTTSSRLLKRITNTPYVNEIMPVFYLPGFYSFVSDISGIYNAYAAKDTIMFTRSEVYIEYRNGKIDTLKTSYTKLPEGHHTQLMVNGVTYHVDSVIKNITVRDFSGETFVYYPLTNYKRNMLGRDMASTDDAEYNLLLYDDRYQIFETNVSPEVEQDAQYINIVPTEYRLSTEINYFYGETAPGTVILPEDTTVLAPQPDTAIEKDEDLTRFYFQTDFPPDFILNRKNKNEPSENTPGVGVRGKFYNAIFPDYYVSQLDNSIINTYYHLNTNGNGPSMFANGNIVFQVKTSLSDLLGNHRILAGMRIPFSLSGSDYFIEYQNRAHKINWGVEFFRQSRRNDGPIVNRQYINQLSAGIKLPFNEIVSLRFSAIGRQDRSRIMGIDSSSLRAPDVYYNWAGTKAELVYDNTKNIDINLPFGARFKLFAELYQDVNAASRKVINLGIDYRKYVKLHNKIVWATRLSANTSVGSSKVQYYMGGVENWIGPSFDGTVSRGTGEQYIFQSQANGLRGFKQNIRNGTSYALINTEIRFPVAAYVTQKPVKADYLRNFLLVPFFDVGTAWYGSSPFNEQPYNTRVIQGAGYTVTLTSAESPIVASAGIGARTRILGYYLRTDFAWGYKDGRFSDHMIQFALGYDF